MPVYQYRCDKGHVEEHHLPVEDRDHYTGRPCDACLSQRTNSYLVRKFQVQFARVMQEHWNPSVGKPISSMKQFQSELDRKSDAATARNGIPHEFVPVDPSDMAAR